MPAPEELANDPKRREVKFTRMEEPIGKWYLEDGTTITFRVAALRVHRLEGTYHPDRTPVYEVDSKLNMATDSPDRLRFDVRNWGRDQDDDDNDLGGGRRGSFSEGRLAEVCDFVDIKPLLCSSLY